MIAQYQPPGKNRRTGVRVYTCHKRSRERAPVPCSQKSMVETRIEVPIWKALKRLLMQPEGMLGEIEALQGKDDPRPTLIARQAQIEKQLKQIESKRERLLDLYIDGAVEKMAFLERSRKLEREKDGLAKRNISLSQQLVSEEESAFKAASVRQLYKRIGKNLEEADYETKRLVISLLVHRISVNADRLDMECHIPQQFLDGKESLQVALRRNPLVHCDSKHIILFSVKPLPRKPRKSLSEIRREANLEYGLKRNLFYPDGRLKARLGGKPKGAYTLEWHTGKFRDPLALAQFLRTRGIILSYGHYHEQFRKEYIAFVDKALYNRFMLLPSRKHFWLAVKGINFHEEGFHSYSDGISTFFRITPNVSQKKLRGIILKHTDPVETTITRTYKHASRIA